MGSLRHAVGSRLPHRWTNRLRGVARGVDQFLGWPLSPLRPGAVCLYHIGRCGSSVLGEMLNQHRAVRWDREIYFHHFTQGERRFEPWDSEGFLRRRMWCAGRRWYGFEMKFLAQQHVAIVARPLEECVAEIERAGVTHHIVLRRRNALRRMISAEAGTRSGRRHAPSGGAQAAPERVRLRVDAIRFARRAEPQSLVTCLDQIERSYAQLASLLAGRRVLDLTFEEDIADAGPQRGYERVCTFLGIAPTPARPHTRRLHPHSVEALLENYDDVAAALDGSTHEWMLRD